MGRGYTGINYRINFSLGVIASLYPDWTIGSERYGVGLNSQ